MGLKKTVQKNINKKQTVFVALSGGVDSSVAALLLKKQGYNVVGVFMKNWADESFECPWKEDRQSAIRAAAALDILFYTWNFEKEYKKAVVDYMIDGYKKGITPNPDVMCNKKIKFDVFLKRALKEGADYIATGHYVKIQSVGPLRHSSSEASRRTKIKNQNDSLRHIFSEASKSKLKIIHKLYQAKDKNKDQSYFLWPLTQEQLKYCLFPVGEYLKSEVRELARRHKLPTAKRPDSQGICFIGEVKLKDFLSVYLPEKQGDIISVDGEKLGKHNGAWFYTIGQRHGLGLAGGPYFVVDKNVKKNIIYVDKGHNSQNLETKKIVVRGLNWIITQKIKQLKARIRYRGKLASCRVKLLNKNRIEARFNKPQWAPASGQSVVFYGPAGEMYGGGIILANR